MIYRNFLYYLNSFKNKIFFCRAYNWEGEFLKAMESLAFENVHVSYFASRSMRDLINENPEAIKPYIPLTVGLMLIFSMGSAMMSDWVRSKVYMGALGILSALMGTGAAFGLLMYLDVPMSSINTIIPFLMVGKYIVSLFTNKMQFSTWELCGKFITFRMVG